MELLIRRQTHLSMCQMNLLYLPYILPSGHMQHFPPTSFYLSTDYVASSQYSLQSEPVSSIYFNQPCTEPYYVSNYLGVGNDSDHLAVFHQLPEVFLDWFTTQFILPFLRCLCESLLLGLVPASQEQVEAGGKWEGDMGTKEGHLFCERRWDTSDPPTTLQLSAWANYSHLVSGELVNTGYILYILLLPCNPSICK